MTEPFIIAVTHLGNEFELKARFERWGYTHRIAVLIGDDTFVFEPDEEGGYRALTDKPASASVDIALLQAVSAQLLKLQINP